MPSLPKHNSNSCAIYVSSCNNACLIAYGIAILATHFPLSDYRLKTRFAPKIPYVIMPLDRIKRDSGQRSAKIIASWLHYVMIASIMDAVPVSTTTATQATHHSLA